MEISNRKMKLGFVSRIGEFPEREWEEEFRTAKKAGVNHLELIVNYPFLGPLTYTQKQIRYVKELSKNSGVELILHLLPNQYQLPKGIRYKDSPEKFQRHEEFLKNRVFNIASLDEDVRKFSIEEIKRTLRMAKKLNAKLITIHGGSFPSQQDYQQYLRRARRTLEELNLELNGIKLAVENLPTLGHFGNSPNELPIYADNLIYLVDGLENIGICLDIGHANIVEDPLGFYRKISKTGKVWDIHLNDNKGDKDDHLSLGKGNIDFKKFFEELRREKYEGYLSIELDTWNEYPQPMERKERINALNYLRKMFN